VPPPEIEAAGRPIAANSEVLLLLSYEVNFRHCADGVGFSAEKPQDFLRVRSCLQDRVAALSCTNRAQAGLKKMGKLVRSEPRLAYLSSEVKAAQRSCGGTARSTRASYSPLDAIHIPAKNYDQRPRALYRAESFLLLICASRRNYREFNLARIERLICDAATNRTGES